MLQFYETPVKSHYSLERFILLSISYFQYFISENKCGHLYIVQSHDCSTAIDFYVTYQTHILSRTWAGVMISEKNPLFTLLRMFGEIAR